MNFSPSTDITIEDKELFMVSAHEILMNISAYLRLADVSMEDAVSLFQGAFIETLSNEHAEKNITQLCKENVIPHGTKKTYEILKKTRSLKNPANEVLIQFTVQHALQKEGLSFDKLHKQVTQTRSLRSLQKEDLVAYLEQFEKAGFITFNDDQWHLVQNESHIDDSTKPNSSNESDSSNNTKAKSEKALIFYAKSVSAQLIDVLEDRLLQTTEYPCGLRQYETMILEEDYPKLKLFFETHIVPFQQLLIARCGNELKRARLARTPRPKTITAQYTWMWSSTNSSGDKNA